MAKGYFDRKFEENPGYCVHCDRELPLNKHGVCEECWNNSPSGESEDWEDTLDD